MEKVSTEELLRRIEKLEEQVIILKMVGVFEKTTRKIYIATGASKDVNEGQSTTEGGNASRRGSYELKTYNMMEITNKVLEICKNSEGCHKNFPGEIPHVHQLINFLYQNTGWSRTTPKELWRLLWAMQTYAFKHDIIDFYEMILRFTLSECFGEEH